MHGHYPDAATTRHDGTGRIGWSLEWTLPLLISTLLVLVVAIFGSAAYEEMRSSSVAGATMRLGDVSRQLADLARASSAQRAAVLRGVANDSARRGGDTCTRVTIPADWSTT